MKPLRPVVIASLVSALLPSANGQSTRILKDGELREYELTTTAELRDNEPADKRRVVSESADHARVRTGNVAFDALYAMAVAEAEQNSVSQISDGAYLNGRPIEIEAYQTGAKWTYVWTRDLAYSLHLALAGFDPQRAAASLLFKASASKGAVANGATQQIIQDTGSGGSYPISTDRVVWALGAMETLKYLSGSERDAFLKQIRPFLFGTIEQDRRLTYDPTDGLYRGETSFLDWREQSYPAWTADHVLTIGMSKSVSVNAANYQLLRLAALVAEKTNDPASYQRYNVWARTLLADINHHLLSPNSGLYYSYLLSEDGQSQVPVERYDLMGEVLPILLDIADAKQAAKIVSSYPTGPFGPPVIWPQEAGIPIYHNQAVWPFATAYWAKAAKKAGNAAAVDSAVGALIKLAGLNLSNMENYDFVTGQAHVTQGTRQGPVINSQRQLWSVAGYLSMVQDVVFGLDVSLDGIRFSPCITATMRRSMGPSITLENFTCRGKRHQVVIKLPDLPAGAQGICTVKQIQLNGRPVSDAAISDSQLAADNRWEITLQAPTASESKIRMVDVANEAAYLAPTAPTWADTAITAQAGKLTLHYKHPAPAAVEFRILRDGVVCAEHVHALEWTDAQSSDFENRVHSYVVVAIANGNHSHPTPPREFRSDEQQQSIPASSMQNQGGNRVGNHHFENWGKPDHTLVTQPFEAKRSGRHLIRAEFSNGAGPINTGITCAMKKLEVIDATGHCVTSGYLVMPQSGNWQRWDLSSAIAVELKQGQHYTLRISEDEWSRNMSYLQANFRYTANSGGGDSVYNYVNIASLRVLFQK